MKKHFASGLAIAAILFAGAAYAASVDKPQTVRLDRDAVVGGTLVPAGTYRLDLSAGLGTARFAQGKRTVLESPVTVGVEKALYPGIAIHYRTDGDGRDRLTKIVFADSNVKFEFPAEGAATAAASTSGH